METYNFDTFEWAKVLVGKNRDLDKLLKTASKPFIIKVKRQQIVTVLGEKPPAGAYVYYGSGVYLQGVNAASKTPSTIEVETTEPTKEGPAGHRLFE